VIGDKRSLPIFNYNYLDDGIVEFTLDSEQAYLSNMLAFQTGSYVAQVSFELNG
jgi:hypothetical protein